MRSKWILVWFACACGGEQSNEPAVEPTATVTLPTVAPPPPPPPPPPIAREHASHSEVTLTVSFAEASKHPAAARVDAMLRNAPAWRAFPTIVPTRDLDWLVQHEDDMIVHHHTPDAQVDAAIASVAQPTTVSLTSVKAWRGVVNGYDSVFLRAQPQVVRIVRARDAESAATDLVAHPPVAPSFHANEAVRMRVMQPSAMVSAVPEDISEARLWIDSRVADGGADVYVEADCPDAASAQTDAVALAALIQRKNSFAVRLVTAGLFNAVEVKAIGKQVQMHVLATQQQVDAIVSLAASRTSSGSFGP